MTSPPMLESRLDVLLREMSPELVDRPVVFCALAQEPATLPADSLCFFREAEGVTLILPGETADRLGLPWSYEAAQITLRVHSSLEAVGFLAAITAALSAAGISTNVVSAFHHDHLFVPYPLRHKALEVLRTLSKSVP